MNPNFQIVLAAVCGLCFGVSSCSDKQYCSKVVVVEPLLLFDALDATSRGRREDGPQCVSLPVHTGSGTGIFFGSSTPARARG